ncbi:hypothetical protein C8Q75DRAFT_586444 [Abortiporus biennis]|nr:hypothetical protein C8Q75DRAFT_586444 [Abortiporus biennis]
MKAYTTACPDIAPPKKTILCMSDRVARRFSKTKGLKIQGPQSVLKRTRVSCRQKVSDWCTANISSHKADKNVDLPLG